MPTQIFENEGEMQKWLSTQLSNNNCLNELITNIDLLTSYSPTNFSDKKILESFAYCIESLYLVRVISENENISLNRSDILKPDFLLYAPETESIIIVELKNLITPARQAGTEVGAYANEVKTYIPFISDGDIVNVIISPVWSVLLRHYAFHEIFWQQRNILCLQPVESNGQISLEIVDIKSIAEDAVTLMLGNEHLGGYQICLYDNSLYNDPGNLTHFDPFVNQMKAAIYAMAAKANSQRNHGFAFLWKDTWTETLAPYSITIVNFAPFQSFERHFHTDGFTPNEIAQKFIEIITDYQPQGHGNSLHAIFERGKQVLGNFCEPRQEGFLHWGALKETMIKRGTLISFRCWGIFEEIFTEQIIEQYKSGTDNVADDDPFFGLKVIEKLIDPDYEHFNLSYYNYDPNEDDDND